MNNNVTERKCPRCEHGWLAYWLMPGTKKYRWGCDECLYTELIEIE